VRYGPDPGYDPALGITPSPRRSYLVETTTPQKLTPGRLLMGLGLASAVGFLGALGIEKIAFTINFDITNPSVTEAPGFRHGEEVPPCPSEDKILFFVLKVSCSIKPLIRV